MTEAWGPPGAGLQAQWCGARVPGRQRVASLQTLEALDDPPELGRSLGCCAPSRCALTGWLCCPHQGIVGGGWRNQILNEGIAWLLWPYQSVP